MSNKSFGIITFDGTTCKTYASVKDAAKQLRVSESTIRRALYSTLKDVGDLKFYYNSTRAINEIAKLIQEKQIKLAEESKDEEPEDAINPIELARQIARNRKRKKRETPESFAKALTDSNEYLTHEWERRLHHSVVKEAYMWGNGIINKKKDNIQKQ